MRSSSIACAVILSMAFGYGAFAQLTQTGMGGKAGGGVPSVCLGVIDLSVGCAMPMLGGAP